MNLNQRQRRVALEGAANFRDLGGYPVVGGRRTRWGRLFRSDSLADLTDSDARLLDTLGLDTLIDFRLPVERQRKPNRLPPGTRLRSVEIGFMPDGALDMIRQIVLGAMDAAAVERETLRHYRQLPAAHIREYAELFDRIEAAEGRPVLFHCTIGKDRTGFAAAAILLALGATRATVLEDYTLTNQYRRDLGFMMPTSVPRPVLDMLMSAQPKYLEASLAAIDQEFGSADAYLERALRLPAARRERLRDLLTEPG